MHPAAAPGYAALPAARVADSVLPFGSVLALALPLERCLEPAVGAALENLALPTWQPAGPPAAGPPPAGPRADKCKKKYLSGLKQTPWAQAWAPGTARCLTE